MLAITLDMNCLIDVEQGNEYARPILDLIARHRAGRVDLRLPAISASEQPRQGARQATNFSEFQARVEKAGLGGLRFIPPMMYLDLAYLDFCILADDDMVALERRIHGALIPDRIEYVYADYCRVRGLNPEQTPMDKVWRNAKCDVQGAWSHIYHGGNVLVTRDENFHKATKKSALRALGAGAIIRPDETPPTG